MRIIKKIPWKALLILLVGLMLGLGLGVNFGHKISWLSFEKTLNSKTVSEAVNKPTNEVNNKIEVPKIKKSQPVQIIMSPNNEQIVVRDTCLGIDYTKLNDSQKRRLEKWLKD